MNSENFAPGSFGKGSTLLYQKSAAARVLDDFFRFIGHEIIHGFLGAGAGHESVVITHQKAAGVHARIEEAYAVGGGLVHIHVYMDEGEAPVRNVIEPFRYPAGVDADFCVRPFYLVHAATEVALTPVAKAVNTVWGGDTLEGIKEKVGALLRAGLCCLAYKIGACAPPNAAFSRIAGNMGGHKRKLVEHPAAVHVLLYFIIALKKVVEFFVAPPDQAGPGKAIARHDEFAQGPQDRKSNFFPRLRILELQ
jgi:hypothetical protein